MSNRGIIDPSESGQYDLSKEEEDDVDRANEIKRVKEDMSKLADKLASIEKGIAVKRKRDEVDKVVGFDLKKIEMHVIPVNLGKKVDLSATAYAPLNPHKNDIKGYGGCHTRGGDNYNSRNGNRSWNRQGNRHVTRNDARNNWYRNNDNHNRNTDRNGPSNNQSPPPYSPKSPLIGKKNASPEKAAQTKVSTNNGDGWGSNSPQEKRSAWGNGQSENGGGWSTPNKANELTTDGVNKNAAEVSIAETEELPDCGTKVKDELFRNIKYTNLKSPHLH